MKRKRRKAAPRVSIVRILKEQDRELAEKVRRIESEAEGIATLHHQILLRLEVLDKVYAVEIRSAIAKIEELREFTDKFFEVDSETVNVAQALRKVPEASKHGFTIFLEKLVNLFQAGKRG